MPAGRAGAGARRCLEPLQPLGVAPARLPALGRGAGRARGWADASRAAERRLGLSPLCAQAAGSGELSRVDSRNAGPGSSTGVGLLNSLSHPAALSHGCRVLFIFAVNETLSQIVVG